MTLEERIEKLELENVRLDALNQIQNLVATYAFYHAANMNTECVDLFAKKTPGVAIDIPHVGVFEGENAAERCYKYAHNAQMKTEEDKKGFMMVRPFTTPLIQVAKDGMTAQGAWISPGISTGGNPKVGYGANWAWIKYACDFVNENGTWKIWHLRAYGIFLTDFHKSWVETSIEKQNEDPKAAEERAKMMAERKKNMDPRCVCDRSNDDYAWEYGTDKVYPVDQPTPFKPYDTWDDSMSVIGP